MMGKLLNYLRIMKDIFLLYSTITWVKSAHFTLKIIMPRTDKKEMEGDPLLKKENSRKTQSCTTRCNLGMSAKNSSFFLQLLHLGAIN